MRGNGRCAKEWRGVGRGMNEGMEGERKEKILVFVYKHTNY